MTDTYIPIPWSPGQPQPRISDGAYRAIRADGNGGFEGVPNGPSTCRLTLRRAGDGSVSGTLSCGEVSVEVTDWKREGDVVTFSVDASFEAMIRRWCEGMRG